MDDLISAVLTYEYIVAPGFGFDVLYVPVAGLLIFYTVLMSIFRSQCPGHRRCVCSQSSIAAYRKRFLLQKRRCHSRLEL